MMQSSNDLLKDGFAGRESKNTWRIQTPNFRESDVEWTIAPQKSEFLDHPQDVPKCL